MSNRFAGKSCVLCPNPSQGVGEHVWPHWLIQDLHGEAPFTTEKEGVPYTKRDRVTPVRFGALPGAHVPMCEPCNTQLNRSIEEPAKPVVRRLLPWSASHHWPTISADEAAALARWFLKIGLLAAHPETVHDNPHVDRDADFPRFDRMEPEWLPWMRTGCAPPEDFSVYVVKRSIMGDQPWQQERHRISLPRRVIVGNQELRFLARSFGVRGLDATIVWHPRWPILHPLHQAGRLARLWPHPSAVDFGALPEVHPREVAFDVGLGTRIMSDAQFEEATRRRSASPPTPSRRSLGTRTVKRERWERAVTAGHPPEEAAE